MSSMIAPVHRQVAQIMGLPISLALRGRHAGTATGRAAWADVAADLREADRLFSTYREDSFVCRLDRGELELADCPGVVAEVLELGRRAADWSAGTFSVLLPGPDGRQRLDPSGVVKGWATERASRRLAALEDTDHCLSAGGDLTCAVADPARPPWQIGIEHPHRPSTLIATVPVRTGSVATSGTAHRGHHILDARTGRPARGVSAVTVVGSSLIWSDIAATAAFGHGVEAADWLRAQRLTGLVVWPDGTTTVVDGRPASHDRRRHSVNVPG